MSPSARFGFAGTLHTADVEAGAMTFDVKTYAFDLYGGWRSGGSFVNATVGGSVDHYDDITRVTSLAPIIHTGDTTGGSIGAETALQLPDCVAPIKAWAAAAKAVTDGEIAVAEAIARGATRLIFAGALGGERSDHALQHYLNALGLVEDGYEVVLTSGEEEAYPFVEQSELALELPKGALFSVLGFTTLEGLTIRNARYPLQDFRLPFGSSRTISNIAEGPISVSLSRGRAMLLARPNDFSGA